MKKLIPLLGILAFFAINSCKKKDLTYQIKGTVYDSSFNSPLAGAQVVITATSSGSVGSTLATLTTDANGNYSYELKRDKYQSISISVTKANYFSDGSTTTLDNLSLKDDNAFN
ncbi:carboxypeptidase-like regulatory domain-containing protein [Fluviicola sp.]|uniref:carboxypeptidase-like regulatory domain-containing protein n=1 Tax=Fluviicola sp. TaxID=1917219 RepID=UPI002603E334|nr:carboxypeptidase-like regulatory domain-containing protein [Fluviicola sp.]